MSAVGHNPVLAEFHAAHVARQARLCRRPLLPLPVSPPLPEPVVPKREIRSLPMADAHVIAWQLRSVPKCRILAVMQVVARVSGFSVRDLQSASRSANVVAPRQVAMALAREVLGNSLPEIGRRFGGRDHKTVLFAVQKIADRGHREPYASIMSKARADLVFLGIDNREGRA